MKMDPVNKDIPVEILVDIKDEKCLCSHINSKAFIKPCNTEKEKLKTEIPSSSNENSTLFSDSCPIAVLVDVSPYTRFSFKDIYVSGTSVSECFIDEPAGNKTSNAVNHDLNEKSGRNSNHANDCKEEDSLSPSNSSEVQCQMSVNRLRWRTPSPKSMSRISKEASKVIDQLNSSSIFNEDLLLTEEMLPIALNFDELDDTDEKSSIDNVFEDIVLNDELSVDQQMLGKTERNNEKLNNCLSKSVSCNRFQDHLEHAYKEKNINESSCAISIKNDHNSSKSSSGIHSNSLTTPDSLTFHDEVDDFSVTHIASEDKENVQNKKNKENVGNKTGDKISSLKKSKLDQRGTLRNLSNIKPEASVKHLSVSVNKSVTTPLKRMSISASKKIIVPHTEKPLAKKTTLTVDSHYSRMSFYQSRLNTVSKTPKLLPTTKIDSGCSSLSSGVKQNVFATPSRRYSICTPLKSASAMKPPLTPALNSSHTFAFPSYTPQPAKPSRLSFSRSWQHSTGNSQVFSEKRFRQPISTTIPSSSSKIEFGIKKLTKPGKLSFSHSMSAVSAQSFGKNASSKGRSSNKLPSSVVDKKVARALFTNVSVK